MTDQAMQNHIIDRAEVFLVGPDVERYTWAEGMTDQYMVNIILRLTARSGLQGLAGAAMITPHGFDRSVGEALRAVLPDLIGKSPAYREALWRSMRNFGTPMVPQAHSLIDIALWDMAARHAGLPLYQLLGGARDDDDVFDLHLSLGYQHSWRNSKIYRENTILQTGLARGGFTSTNLNVAKSSQTISRLNTRADIGVFKDIALVVRVPVILSDDRELTANGGTLQTTTLQGAPGLAATDISVI